MLTSLPVLTFHAVDDKQDVISFSPGVFRRGMARLYEDGYQSIDLPEVLEYLLNGDPFPVRSFAITFDDGYSSVFEEAFPVIQQYGMSATIFPTVGNKRVSSNDKRLPSMQGRSMMSWGEIREMHRYGISFGAHTINHPDLTSLPVERVEEEILDSKSVIEDALGAPVNCFAYPFGRYDERIREIVKRYFDCGCTDRFGLVKKGCDHYTLNRIDAYYLRTDRLFDIMFSRFFPWYINAISVMRRIRRSFLL